MPGYYSLIMFTCCLRSGPVGLSRFMRRLMTRYAITFNRKYRRSGHLFQNRFTSIVCEEQQELAAQFAKELGISYAEIARHLGVSTSAITKMLSPCRAGKAT